MEYERIAYADRDEFAGPFERIPICSTQLTATDKCKIMHEQYSEKKRLSLHM